MSSRSHLRRSDVIEVKACNRCGQDWKRTPVDGGCRCEFLRPDEYTLRRFVALDTLAGIRAKVNGEVVVLHPDDVELVYVSEQP